MDKEKFEVKERLRNIVTVSEFEDLIDQIMLSDEEKQILRMIYKDKKTISYIADTIGLSERSVKKKHSKALLKIGKSFASL